jgi:hypothetical protein
VYIQPPAGETWLIEIAFSWDQTGASLYDTYYDYDGTTLRAHVNVSAYAAGFYGDLVIERVLTNTLYAALKANNLTTSSYTFYYGYSGFKLSKPLWSPERLADNPGKPWKKPTTLPLPDIIKPLDKYKAEMLGLDPTKPDEYVLGIILEEDTPLAIDPATGFPVERLTAVVKADVLADFIAKFKAGKADPATTGYSKYLKRWKAEGVDFGIPGI